MNYLKLRAFLASRHFVIGFVIILPTLVVAAAMYYGTRASAQDSIPERPGAIFMVTNTNDSGAGSLRQAIINANGNAGADTIVFSLGGAGVRTIAPLSDLPVISGPTFIDGESQPDFVGSPLIELSGVNVPGGQAGFNIIASGCRVRGLIINRFALGGILIFGSNSLIEGNHIGLSNTGVAGAGNAGTGIYLDGGNNVVGGTSPSQRNVISGNGNSGIQIVNSLGGNQILGNYIGTNIAGTAAIPNVGTPACPSCGRGVEISDGQPTDVIGGTAPGARNVISGNEAIGILLSDSTGVQILGNYIGTNATGNGAIPNDDEGINLQNSTNTVVGGTVAAARNVISGNNGDGISLFGSGNRIEGNYIGINAVGNSALGNRLMGITLTGSASNNIIGGTANGSQNVISGNGVPGFGGIGVFIIVNANGNFVQQNLIGTDATGVMPVGNFLWGISMGAGSPSNNLIGGTAANAGNTIAFNGQDGVAINGGLENPFIGNRLFSNGDIGIDLTVLPEGVTPNDVGDGDTGPNNLQNFPVLANAVTAGANTTIQGSLNSLVSTSFRIEFFTSPSCDPSGNGEGQNFVGFANVTTDVAGNAPINVSFPALPNNVFITSTATRLNLGNPTDTSEFSQCIGFPAGAISFSQANFFTFENSGQATVTLNRTGGSTGAVTANLAYDPQSAQIPQDFLPNPPSVTWGDGDSAPKNISIPIVDNGVVEDFEQFQIAITGASGGATIGGPSVATVGIFDNDSVVNVTRAPPSTAETLGGPIVYTFTRDSVQGFPLTVFFSLTGNAQPTVDYTIGNATLSSGTTYSTQIPAGSTQSQVIITPISDTFVEPNETVIATLIGSAYTIGPFNTATGMIIDDDNDIICVLSPQSVAENGVPNLVSSCTRTATNLTVLQIPFTLGSPPATFGTDYTVIGADAGVGPGGGTITFQAGSNNVNLEINPVDDSLVEGPEQVIVTFQSGPTFDILPNPTVLTGTITDDDVSAGVEGDVVDSNGGPQGDGLVGANDVTALRQFTLGLGTPVTSPNQFQRADVNTLPCGNGAIDVGDILIVRRMILGSVPNNTPACGPTTGGSIGPPGTSPTRIIRAVSTVSEAGQNVTVQIQLDSLGNETGSSFNIGWNPAVYSFVTATIGGGVPAQTFLNLNTSQTGAGRLGVLIDSTNTYVVGTRQIMTLTLATAANAASGTFPITFDPAPAIQNVVDSSGASLPVTFQGGLITNGGAQVLQFSTGTFTQNEGAAAVTFTVNRTGGSSGTVGAQYSTTLQTATPGGACAAGVDYINLTGSVSFGPGVTSQNIVIPICDDALHELSETFGVVLANPTGGATLGGQSNAAGVIVDNDPQPTLSISDVTVNEASGTATISVLQNFASGVATNFAYVTGAVGDTATANEDYTPTSGVGTIPAGSANFTVAVPINNDTLAEPNETFSMILSSAVNATFADNIGLVTIQDNDSGGCPATPISYGQTFNGVITDLSCIVDGGRVDLYSFNGTAGQRIVINMTTAGGFQARLQLMSPANVSLGEVSGQPAFNDARLPTTNSFQLPATGLYTIRAKEQFFAPRNDEFFAIQTPNALEGNPPNPYNLSLNLVQPGGCTYSFAPRTNAIPAGGEYSFFVVTQPGCPMADPPPRNGNIYQGLTYRNNLVRFTVLQNPNAAARQDTITIAPNQTHTINQFGTAIPSNDNLINAQTITGASSRPGEFEEITLPDAPAEGYNTAATAEILEPAHAGNTASRSVWYSWTAPGPLDGLYSFTTSGSSFDTVMAIYECPVSGTCNFSNFTRVGFNDDTTFYDNTSKVNFRAQSARRYVIAIDGKNGATGTIQLTWRSYVRLFRLYLQNYSGFPSSFVPTSISASNGSNTVQAFLISRGVYEFSLPNDNTTYFINILGPAGIIWSPNNIPIGTPPNRPNAPEGGLDGVQNVVSNATNAFTYTIAGFIKDLDPNQISSLRVKLTNAQGPNVQPASDCGPSVPAIAGGSNYAVYGCTSQPETNHEVVPARPATRFRLPVRVLDGYVNGPAFESEDKALVATTSIPTNSINGQVLFGGVGTQVDLKYFAPGISREIGLSTTTGLNGSFAFPDLERNLTYSVRAVRTGIVFTQPTPIPLVTDQIVNIPATACTFTPGPIAEVPGTGGLVQIDITTSNPTCEWTTTSNFPWIAINSGEFPGNGPIHLTVEANSGAARTGSIRLLGRTEPITFQQAAGGVPNVEGDVADGAGGAAGDGLVQSNDVVRLRNFILSGTIPPSTPNQFQRADVNLPCGNGGIDAGDVTVVRNMILGNVPNDTPSCGPTQPPAAATMNPEQLGRSLDAAMEKLFYAPTVVSIGLPEYSGNRFFVPVKIDSSKGVAGLSFSLSFDHETLEYAGARLGTGSPGTAVLTINDSAVKEGKLGILIDSVGEYMPGKNRVAMIEFKIKSRGASSATDIRFGGMTMFSGVNSASGALVDSVFKDGRIFISNRSN